MKIIWVSKDSEIVEMVDGAQESAWLLVETPSEAQDLLEDGDCALFIDYDIGVKECDKLAVKAMEKNCSCFLITSKMSTKEIKKHQESKKPLTGYFLKPIDKDDINDFLESLELSVSFTSTSTRTSELEFGETGNADKTVMKAVPVENKKKALSDFDADFDDEIIETAEEDSEEETETESEELDVAEVQEIKMDEDVKKVMRSHEMITPPDLNHPVNVKLQKQFDSVFGERDYSDLEEAKASSDFDDDGLADMMAEVASAPAKISIDLGAEESDQPDNVLALNQDKKNKSKEVSMTKKDSNDLSIAFDLGGEMQDDAPAPTEAKKSKSADLGSIELDESILFDLDSSAPAVKSPSAPASAGNHDSGLEMESLTATDENSSAEGGIELGGGDDSFELETSSSSEGGGANSKGASVELSMDGDDGFELETTGGAGTSDSSASAADDLSFDAGAEEIPEDATKTETSDDLDFDNAEFDYKTSMTNKSKVAKAPDLSDDGDSDEATKVLSASDVDSEFDIVTDDMEIEDSLLGSEEKTTMLSTSSKGGSKNASGKNQESFNLDEDEGYETNTRASINRPVDDRPIIIGVERVPTAMLREDELVKLHATLEHLKKEREELVGQINCLKDEKKELQHENTGLRADLDKVRIELSIVKKRADKDRYEVVNQLKVSEEKRSILEQKCRTLTRDLEMVSDKVRVDVNKVRQKEKELESKLELHSIDSEAQVRARDQKILELKRKIDSLEFNMENASIREHKFAADKRKLEDKLKQVIQALRNSIQNINEDFDMNDFIDRENGKKP
jgi:hypothetical protein